MSELEDEILSTQRQTEHSMVDVERLDAWLMYHATDTHQLTAWLNAFSSSLFGIRLSMTSTYIHAALPLLVNTSCLYGIDGFIHT